MEQVAHSDQNVVDIQMQSELVSAGVLSLMGCSESDGGCSETFAATCRFFFFDEVVFFFRGIINVLCRRGCCCCIVMNGPTAKKWCSFVALHNFHSFDANDVGSVH